MHRPGADPDSMDMSDVLCDFCGRPWSDDLPMVEGHRGSCICGRCLRVAYHEVVRSGGGEPPRPLGAGLSVADLVPGAPALAAPRSDDGRLLEPCCLCLETNPGVRHWRSPLSDSDEAGSLPAPSGAEPDAATEPPPPHRHKLACRTCISMAARALEMDKEAGWSRPGRPPAGAQADTGADA